MAHELLDCNETSRAPLYEGDPEASFREAPRREVGRGSRKASLRPSPTDIPTRVEIAIIPPKGASAESCVAVARFEYPSDSEPSEQSMSEEAKVYVGEYSGRIMAVETSLPGAIDDLGLADAVEALRRAIRTAYDSIPKGKRSTVRKELNNELIRSILSRLTESHSDEPQQGD